jgi:hypothetical protein
VFLSHEVKDDRRCDIGKLPDETSWGIPWKGSRQQNPLALSKETECGMDTRSQRAGHFSLIRFARQKKLLLRFIELMPVTSLEMLTEAWR